MSTSVQSGSRFLRWDDGARSLFLCPETGAWVVVEGTGPEVIELHAGGCSQDQIARHLAAKHDVELTRAQSDVATYLAQLESAGFLSPKRPRRDVDVSPKALALHVTSRCSLRCRHCYGSAVADEQEEPSLGLLVSAVEQARALGADSFTLTGGEPLQRPEAIGVLEDPTRGAEVTVLTNAMAPYGELRRLATVLGWRLQISIDGPDAKTHDWYRGPGAHAQVTSNLDALARDGLGPQVTLSVCISRVNRDGIEGIIHRAMAWGVSGLHLVRISPQGRAKEHWSDLRLSPEEWGETYGWLADLHARYGRGIRLTGFVADYVLGCLRHPSTAGCRLGQSAMVGLDGRVYPCIMMGQPEHCLGDLQLEPLSQCLSPDRIQPLQERCDQRTGDTGVCGACEWRMVCRGACPGWSVVQDGTLDATDDLCELRRELFPRLILELTQPTV